MIPRFRLARASTNRSYSQNGSLFARNSAIAKIGVTELTGREIERGGRRLGLDPAGTYRIFFPPEELRKAASTVNGAPLLDRPAPTPADDHPKEITVGVVWDGEFAEPWLRATLVVWPEYASSRIEDNSQRALAPDMAWTADMTPGEHDGVRYDGTARAISISSVALVTESRIPGAMAADLAVFPGRSTPMKQYAVYRSLALAADASFRKHRARDMARPSDADLDEERVEVPQLIECIKRSLEELDPQQAEEFLEKLADLAATGDQEMAHQVAHEMTEGREGEDRARRGVHGARRARGTGDRHAHDTALRGIKPAHERFLGVGRHAVLG